MLTVDAQGHGLGHNQLGPNYKTAIHLINQNINTTFVRNQFSLNKIESHQSAVSVRDRPRVRQ